MRKLADRLARAIVARYPRVWRERYHDEMLALLDDAPVGWGRAVDIARAAAVEWRDRSWRWEMFRGALLIAIAGAAFVLFSTLTSVDYGLWLWINAGFGLLVTGTAFVCAASGSRPSWRRGFGAGAIGTAAFSAFLLPWVYGAAPRLVQLPFEHFSYESSGAASVSEYLASAGADFWSLVIFAWVLMLFVIALVSAGGALFGRWRGRLAERVHA